MYLQVTWRKLDVQTNVIKKYFITLAIIMNLWLVNTELLINQNYQFKFF